MSQEDEQKKRRAKEDGQSAEPGDESLEAASEEAVSFMEDGDEPGHAGRGDGG